MDVPDYQELSAGLEAISAPVEAGECHGILCGLLCVASDLDDSVWAPHVLDELSVAHMAAADTVAMINRVIDATRASLFAEQFKFQPMLPDDEESLNERSRVLGLYCQGLLFGIGLGGVDESALKDGDCSDFVRDLARIANISPDQDSYSDEDESAWMELIEYVRAGVMILYEDLHALEANSDAGSPQPGGTH